MPPIQRLYLVLYLLKIVYCKENAVLILRRNPVYSGEEVVVTCIYGNGKLLVNVMVNAYSSANKEGFLWCRVTNHTTSGDGVFRGKNFAGCPSLSAGSTNVSVAMIASPSLELDFNCSTTVANNFDQFEMFTSNTASLIVNVPPSIPVIKPNTMVFSEDEEAVITCECRNGKPRAALQLTVTSRDGTELRAEGVEFASLAISFPLSYWHNATATCTVRNHDLPNMTKSAGIRMNHLFSTANNVAVSTHASNATLDCSEYIRSYPDAHYTWAYPTNISDVHQSLVKGSMLTVLQGESGSFNCTAINNITRKSVIVVFTADSNNVQPRSSLEAWLIGGACCAVVIILVNVLVAYKRRCFATGCQHHCVARRISRNVSCPIVEDIQMERNPLYDELPAQPVQERSSNTVLRRKSGGTPTAELPKD